MLSSGICCRSPAGVVDFSTSSRRVTTDRIGRQWTVSTLSQTRCEQIADGRLAQQASEDQRIRGPLPPLRYASEVLHSHPVGEVVAGVEDNRLALGEVCETRGNA